MWLPCFHVTSMFLCDFHVFWFGSKLRVFLFRFSEPCCNEVVVWWPGSWCPPLLCVSLLACDLQRNQHTTVSPFTLFLYRRRKCFLRTKAWSRWRPAGWWLSITRNTGTPSELSSKRSPWKTNISETLVICEQKNDLSKSPISDVTESCEDDFTLPKPVLGTVLFRPEGQCGQDVVELGIADFAVVTTKVIEVNADRIVENVKKREMPRFK